MSLCHGEVDKLQETISFFRKKIKMKDELIQQAGFSSTYEKDRLYQLIDLTLKECLDLVEQTPQSCAYTTHDLNTVNCTIQESLNHITEKFNLPKRKKE